MFDDMRECRFIRSNKKPSNLLPNSMDEHDARTSLRIKCGKQNFIDFFEKKSQICVSRVFSTQN